MDELISKRVALDALNELDWKYSIINRGDVVGAIKQLSPIQPEPHWIPVTERLPENGRQVLVYARSVHYALAKYDEMREADGTYKKQWVTFDAWKPLYTIKEVIAWCELPNCPNLTRG